MYRDVCNTSLRIMIFCIFELIKNINMSEKKVLAINPGSTTTKLAVYEGEKLFWEIKINHSPDELIHFSNVLEQFDFRKDIIVKALEEAKLNIKKMNV